MRLFHCSRAWVVAWLGGIGLSMACQAGALSYAQIQEQIVYGPPILGDSMTYDSGQLATIALSNTLSALGPIPAFAGGSVNQGAVHGLAQSGVGSGGQANFAGFWNDAITVGGLPAGTPVSIRITDSMHSFVSAVQQGSSASAVSQLEIFFGGNNYFLDLSNTTTNLQNGFQTASMTIQCSSGPLSCFSFNEELALRTASFGVAGQATADAQNTNIVFIDILTPGATISSQSGVAYASTSAVPEPATAVPVLTAIAALLFFKRGKR
jgi:hypothetical protein